MTTHATRTEQIFSMRELTQNTAKVMKQINASNRPALITLRGRFVAMITPLTSGEMESKLVSAALAAGAAASQAAEQESPPRTTREVAQKLGIDVPDYGNRTTTQDQ